jgi:hypothetical protein
MRQKLGHLGALTGACFAVAVGTAGSAGLSLAAANDEVVGDGSRQVAEPQAEPNGFHGEALACDGIVGVTRAEARRALSQRGYTDAHWHHSVGNMPRDGEATDDDIVVDVKAIGEEVFVHSVPVDDPWAAERRVERSDC